MGCALLQRCRCPLCEFILKKQQQQQSVYPGLLLFFVLIFDGTRFTRTYRPGVDVPVRDVGGDLIIPQRLYQYTYAALPRFNGEVMRRHRALCTLILCLKRARNSSSSVAIAKLRKRQRNRQLLLLYSCVSIFRYLLSTAESAPCECMRHVRRYVVL